MKIGFWSQPSRTFLMLTAGCLVATIGGMWPVEALAQSEQPIAYIGHGAFFDSKGNEIKMTLAFVEKAQAWYRADFLSGLDATKKRDFAQFEKRLYAGVEMKGQTRLVVQQRALEWLFFNSPKHKDDDRTEGKLHALEYALKWQLPEREGQNIGDQREEFKLDAELVKRLESAQFKPDGGVHVLSATVNLGQAYINECAAAPRAHPSNH